MLLDNGRTTVLADEVSRETLDCIRCAACLNACPVYRQTGGHAYGSVYSGPIGAILTPQLQSMQHSTSLPYASSLCGACYEVCPVKINIPEILIHLRRRIVEQQRADRRAAEHEGGGAGVRGLVAPVDRPEARRARRSGRSSAATICPRWAASSARGPMHGISRRYRRSRFGEWWAKRGRRAGLKGAPRRP